MVTTAGTWRTGVGTIGILVVDLFEIFVPSWAILVIWSR
jgi:hypothetical protein